MTIQIQSFDGHDLQDASFEAWIPYEGSVMSRESNPIVLDVIGGFARDEGFDHRSARLQIGINVKTTLTTGMDTLKQRFRVGQAGELVVSFDGTDRVRDCRVEAVFPYAGSPTKFLVNLIAADPRWRKPALTEVAAAITATGQTFNVANAGNAIDDKPVFRFTPTTNKAASTTWLYRRPVILANLVKRSLGDWPIEITEGLNHAALVTAVKSQADGDDVRVLVDGIEVARFFGENAANDANSAATNIWATPALSAALDSHLLAAITAGAPANDGELLVRKGETRPFPGSGALLNPTSGEVIAYTGVTESNASGNAAFTGVKRAQRSTSAATGAAGDRLVLLEREVEIIYGHTGIAAPEARPDQKPMLDLTSAMLTNLRHEWINFYDDLYPTRPGQWSRVREDRDGQSHLMFLPTAPSTPAPNADFEYIYSAPPGAKDNFNVLRRAFPVGTEGASGQITFNRVIDQTLALYLLGVMDNGAEQELAAVRGAVASATYTYTGLSKFSELAFYARSQVTHSTPEVKGSKLVDYTGSSTQVAAADTSGTASQIVTNTSAEPMLIHGAYVCIWEPGPGAEIAVTMYVLADDGAGAPAPSKVLGQLTITTAQITSAAMWLGGAFTRPFPLMPGGSIHVYLSVAGGTHSSVLWRDQPMVYADTFPMHGIRLIGDGEIEEEAQAEENENATVDNVMVKFDAASVPYVAMQAEQGCYWLNGTLTNQTTLQAVTFNLFVGLNDVIELDMAARTLRNLTTGEDLPIAGYKFTDAEAGLSIVPGTNVFRWDEAGCAGITIECDTYGRYE